MVTGSIAERWDGFTAMSADEAVIIFFEAFIFHLSDPFGKICGVEFWEDERSQREAC